MPAGTDPVARLVVGSSFIIRLLTRLPESRYAALWREWEGRGIEILAPSILGYEVTNALWQYEQAGDLSTDAVNRSLNRMRLMQIRVVDNGEMHLRALDIVRQFPERNASDSHFLALADLLGCELWTSDKRLYNRVGSRMPWVKLADD